MHPALVLVRWVHGPTYAPSTCTEAEHATSHPEHSLAGAHGPYYAPSTGLVRWVHGPTHAPSTCPGLSTQHHTLSKAWQGPRPLVCTQHSG